MKETKYKIKQDMEKRIEKLRLKLNEIYLKHGNTEEVVKISQDLDKYIFFVQQKYLERSKNSKDMKSEEIV